MLRASLLCHPASPDPAVSELGVSVCRLSDGSLQLCFQLSADLNAFSIPAELTQPDFSDGLWQHTCFEAFIAGEGSAYREFNFSPSGQWATYAFATYRERDSTWRPVTTPSITLQQRADGLTLNAHIPASLLPATSGTLKIGLSTVIEDSQGRLSYWALAHPGERPDFHRHESFTVRLDTATDQP